MATASLSLPVTSRSERHRRETIRAMVYHGSMIVLSFLMLYPILWMFASSLKPTEEIWTNVSSLIPSHITFEHYLSGWAGFGGVSFSQFYLNSFYYAGVGTLLTILSSSVVAYGFARLRFVGKNLWFTLMLLTLMLPAQVQIIPQYIMFNKLGWVNTFSPLLVPRIGGSAFFIFLIVQFIRGLPRELDEAAQMDGCTKYGIFIRIIFPLIRPAIITSAIFSFYWTWEDFLTPVIYLNDPKLYTVSLALRSFADPAGVTDWGAVFAMTSLSLVPVFALFIAFQRYLVEGISTTGLKG